jgi:hypothetical protein
LTPVVAERPVAAGGQGGYDGGQQEEDVMTQSERFGIIERLLRSRRRLALPTSSDRLGVSRATLFRDLRDLRDRMRVPIILDHATGNYRIDCSVERYELPGVWFSAGEIHALLSMQQLLAAFDTGGILAEHISPLRERLASMLETGQIPPTTSCAASAFSAPPPGTLRPNTFPRSPPPSWNVGGSASSTARAATAHQPARNLAAAPDALPRQLVSRRLVPPARRTAQLRRRRHQNGQNRR